MVYQQTEELSKNLCGNLSFALTAAQLNGIAPLLCDNSVMSDQIFFNFNEFKCDRLSPFLFPICNVM